MNYNPYSIMGFWSCTGHETNQASFSDIDFAMFCSLQIQLAEMSLI